jgi:hypothetical protein
MDVDGDEEMGDNIDIDGSATKRFWSRSARVGR